MNFKLFFSTFISFTSICVFSQSLLLTSKNVFTNLNFNNDLFAKEHNLNVVVSFDDLVIYETDQLNFNNFDNTLNELFDVEENLEMYVPNPSEGRQEQFEQVVFVQNPGELYFETESSVVPWHLSRIAQRDLPLNDSFPFNTTGSCHTNSNVTINTYVVDTGIDVNHSDFEGRAVWLANFADNEDSDCQSHGTHCAGLIGSRHFGACKDAKLFAIKVLDCRGYGSYSGILKGLNYVYTHHLQQKESSGSVLVKSVVSMSLGGSYSPAINKVVEKLLSYGDIYIVVAAGNENNDACDVSPASAKGALTVMASDKNDKRAYFSNYGECADIYSPGVDIMSTIPDNQHAKYSGTSMSTPQISGILNHYLDMFPHLSFKELNEKILSDSTKDHILNNKKDTNNLLAYLHRHR